MKSGGEFCGDGCLKVFDETGKTTGSHKSIPLIIQIFGCSGRMKPRSGVLES